MVFQPILAADDSVDHLLLVRLQFEQAQIVNPLYTVADGDQVIHYLDGKGIYHDRTKFPAPILLLLDLKMPVKDGFQVLQWIRDNPFYQALPVIVLSAAEDLRDVNKAYKLGARSFLTKPISSAEFRATLEGLSEVNFKLDTNGFYLERR